MKLVKLVLIFIFAGILIQLLASSANPSNLLFPLKRLEEKNTLSNKSNPEDKLNYMLDLADNRLTELSEIVNSKNYRFVLKSSLRYSTQVGEIVNLVKSNNLKDKTQMVTDRLTPHQSVLESLYANYPDPENTERKYVQDDINYLKIYLSELR